MVRCPESITKRKSAKDVDLSRQRVDNNTRFCKIKRLQVVSCYGIEFSSDYYKSINNVEKSIKSLSIMRNSKKLIGGLIAGAALGIAVGLLLAPRSGVKTRKKIVGGSLRFKDDILSSVEDSLESLRKQFNRKIDQLARGGKEIINVTSDKVKV